MKKRVLDTSIGPGFSCSWSDLNNDTCRVPRPIGVRLVFISPGMRVIVVQWVVQWVVQLAWATF